MPNPKSFKDVEKAAKRLIDAINKKQNIEHILLTIKATSNIDYEINDNKIMIK